MTVDVIVNPVHHEALHASARVQGLCARAGMTVAMRTTSVARPHADPDTDARLTVVIGGDGTMREVAGALLEDPRWTGAILPVPTGTASLFALNVGVRTTAQGIDLLEAYLSAGEPAACDARRWELVRCDVGRAEIRRAEGRWVAALPFLVSAGIGHSGTTLLRTPSWAKRLLGAAGYGVGAIGFLDADAVTMRFGPAARPYHAVWAAEFGNISRIPGGITIFPHGGVRTGSLAGLVVSFPGEAAGETRRLRSLRRRIPGWGRVFRAGFSGGHRHVDELRLWNATTAHVETDGPLAAHLDGESVGMVTGLRLRLLPAALPVLVPAGSFATGGGAGTKP